MKKRVLSALMAVAMILSLGIVPTTALADDPADPTVIEVTVTPSIADVQKGTAQSFSAEVTGENSPSQEVTWSIDESVAAGTSISTDGLLTVAADETAGTLTIRATSVADTNFSGTSTVTVIEPPEPTVTGVTVTPSTVDVEKGATQSFSAVVEGTNSPSQEVTWSIVEAVAAGTSISTAGELSVAADETAETLTIRATSVADTNFSGTATVTVTEPPEPTVTGVTVTPSEVDVEKGATQSFSAVVEGTDSPSQEVTWSIDESVAAGTSVSGEGLLTVAADETAETLTIRASSVADTNFSGTATVTVAEAPEPTVTGVTLTPSEADVQKGTTQNFSTEVTGENSPSQEVTWSIDESVVAGTSISTAGELTIAADETSGTLTVRATSVADTNFSGTATVTVTEPVPTVTGVTVTPSEADVEKGAAQSFSAEVTGTNSPSQEVTWSIVEAVAAGTTISTDGLLAVAADETAYTLTVTATSVADGTKSGTAVVTVPSNEPVTINDEGLKYAICKQLGISPGDWAGYIITLSDMESLTVLDASNWNITDLTGISYAVNIEVLDLSGNPLGRSTNSNLFTHLGAMTKMRNLNLSDCSLHDKDLDRNYRYSPLSDTVMQMSELEVLDVSNNGMTGDVYFGSILWEPLEHLKTVDFSGNNICGLTIVPNALPAIETFDISDNNYYFAEGQPGYEAFVDLGVDRVVRTPMRNLASLSRVFALKSGGSNFNQADKFYFGDTDTLDIGTVTGTSFSFALETYSYVNSVKVTVNGEKYTAKSFYESSGYAKITVGGLEPGPNSLTVESMHMGGDTKTYTLVFEVNALPTGGDDSAGILDANLYMAVADKLGITDPGYVITKDDMASLTGSLSVYDCDNLEGIQYATQISTLRAYSGSTFSTIPDLSALTNLSTLLLSSANCDALPDISSLTGLKDITLDMPMLTALPDMSNLPILRTLTLQNNSNLTVLPTGLTGLGDISYFTLTIDNCPNLSLSGLSDLPDELVSVVIKNCENYTIKGIESGNTSIRRITAEYCPGLQLDTSIKNSQNLNSFDIEGCGLTELPDWFGDLTSLVTLELVSNALTEIPASVGLLTNLETLNANQNPSLTDVADLSALTNLKTVKMAYAGLMVFPQGLANVAGLEELDLSGNKLTEITVSLTGLASLKEIKLTNNRFEELPAALKDLHNLEELEMAGNYYTSVPADFFDGLLAQEPLKLNTVYLSGNLKVAYPTMVVYDEPTAECVAKLQAKGVTVSVFGFSQFSFSELKKLEMQGFGEIDGLHVIPGLTPIFAYELNGSLPGATQSVTLIATAKQDDSTITIGDQTVLSGTPITINGLHDGNNVITLTCHNDFTTLLVQSTETVYTINIFVGSGVGDSFPQEGRVYSTGITAMHATNESPSMANSYFKHTAEITYQNGKYAVLLTTTAASWLPSMSYWDPEVNAYVAGDRVAFDAEADTATFRVYATTLDEDLYIKPMVIPMGYAPECRIRFNTATIIDITPATLVVDKTYLFAAISKAEAELAKGIYTSVSVAALQTAYDEAKEMYADADATQAEVDAALEALNNALDNLEVDAEKLADKTALKDALDDAYDITQGNHTETAWYDLQEAIADAQAVYDKQEATQSAVDAAEEALRDAITAFNNSAEVSKLDKDNLEDGKYEVHVDIWHATQNKESMGNGALNHTALIEVINGKLYMSVSGHPMQVGTITASLISLQIKQAGGSYVYAEVIARNIAGGKPSAFRFALPSTNKYIAVKVDPQVEVMGDDPMDARLKIGWDTLKRVSDDATVSSNTKLTVSEDGILSDATSIIDLVSGVKLEADENVLPEGATMAVKAITSGEDYDKATLALEGSNGSFVLYDITLFGSDNAAIQPNGTVKVSIPVPEDMNEDLIILYRINEDGTRTLIECSVEDGYVVFYTNHFSLYAIVEKEEEAVPAAEAEVIEHTDESNNDEAALKDAVVIEDGEVQKGSKGASLLWWLIPIAVLVAGVTILIVWRKRKTAV